MPCRTSFRRNVHSRFQVSKTFGSCFRLSTVTHALVLRTLVSYQMCRRKGAKSAEAERVHGWLTAEASSLLGGFRYGGAKAASFTSKDGDDSGRACFQGSAAARSAGVWRSAAAGR